jgi:hypothetical protein
MEGHWTLGVLIGLPLTILGVIALVLFARWMMREDEPLAGWLAYVAAVVVVIFALSPAGFYPYSRDFHRWEPKTGVVRDTATRVFTEDSGDSKTINQRIVVRFTDRNRFGGDLFGCDDTRCAIIKPGERITLMCRHEWQWAADPGWVCRWGRQEAAA